MKKTILIYGSITGAITIGTMLLGFVMVGMEDAVGLGAWLGYTVIIIALSAIFVGIKRYRDQELGGVIRFGTAFLLGLGISAVAGLVYTVVWEGYLAATDHAFIEEYTTSLVAAKKEEGLAGAELEAFVASMETMKERYASPFFRMPMTFLELFPVGLLVSLVSALVLRRSEVLPAGGGGSVASA